MTLQSKDGNLLVTKEERIVDALRHPLRRQIFRIAVERTRPFSPAQLSKELGRRVTDVAYHVRLLKNIEALVLVNEVPVRGSREHFYVLGDEAMRTADWVRSVLGLEPDGTP
jgi:hypothetical protein